MRIGYLECFSGISGDMLLGALVDAGVPFALLEETTAALNIGRSPGDAQGEPRRTGRNQGRCCRSKMMLRMIMLTAKQSTHIAIAITRRRMRMNMPQSIRTSTSMPMARFTRTITSTNSHEHMHQPHRSLSTILGIIDHAPIADSVKAQASRAFQLLGEAEARIHSMPVEKVHFHEVGAVDTIVDIVCSAVGCAHLGVDRWLASPLNVGSGTVDCAHGTLPVPAPATLALLADAPVYAAGPPMERVTPTGAAILRMLDVRYAPLPAMRVSASGYGAGGRDTPGQPNLLRLLVGEEADQHSAAEPIAIMETVIDDSSPQLIAYVSELLLEAGAWDVYRVPVQMKKGRSGIQLTVLCHPERVTNLRDLLFRETTTIGLHWRIENKISLAREFKEVQTEWGPVRIKIARWPSGEIANAAPEYEDCRRLAAAHSVPLKQVTEQAKRMFAAHIEEER